ncbi:thiazole synthase [Solitalea lacus]|uniref:thiazole synthase n=1 Tax=Solitalea lacus TaxID=2911172 RepID=UPI001EDB2736|nr:thiazole synthase [Solitalea lacus]UKJ06872.1 thiazole synthase [Solitalea lacus]
MNDQLIIGGRAFTSRLFLGTGKFGSNPIMKAAILSSGSELVTAALKRVEKGLEQENLLSTLELLKVNLLPNTSGARTAEEAIQCALLAREVFETDFLKLEIHPDPKYLMPDPVETLKAAEELVKLGFTVLPYIHADPVICKRLEDVGTAAVMPLGAPIGSNQGLVSRKFLEIIIEQSRVPVVVDAGIGRPSDAALAMEIGADAVLVNTAIAGAINPEKMASAFKKAVEAGREAYISGLDTLRSHAEASSPFTEFLDLL